MVRPAPGNRSPKNEDTRRETEGEGAVTKPSPVAPSGDFVDIYMQQISTCDPPPPEEQRRLGLELESARKDYIKSVLDQGFGLGRILELLQRVASGKKSASRVFLTNDAAGADLSPLDAWRDRYDRARRSFLRRRSTTGATANRILAGLADEVLALGIQVKHFYPLEEELRERLDELDSLDGRSSASRARRRAIEDEVLADRDTVRTAVAEIEVRRAHYEKIKQEMTLRNLRLVVNIAGRYRSRLGELTLLDLIQEGNGGLVKSIDRFEASRGFRFSTYATWWIRQAIGYALMDQARFISMPFNRIERIQKMQKFAQSFEADHGVSPSVEQQARSVGCDPVEASQILNASRKPASLDKIVSDEDDLSMGEVLEDLQASERLLAPDHALLRDSLGELLESLPDREQEVVRWRFGLVDGAQHTLEAVGRQLGLSKERIRQLEKSAIGKLAQQGRGKLSPFAEN